LEVWKSNNSTSFVLDNETFLVLPGPQIEFLNNEKAFSIHVYNLTQMKKETILKVGPACITIISSYPQNYFSKKLLYCGDFSSVFRIFEIFYKKNFEEICKITTNDQGIGIISALIFDDKFNEIGEIDNDNTMQTQKCQEYVIFSLSDNRMPLKMFKLKAGGSEAEPFKEINNPHDQICSTINYYSDEEIFKTCLFCGFNSSFVRNYDLKSSNWTIIQFETQNTHVSSINFCRSLKNETNNKKNNAKNLLIYTHWKINTIKIADIQTGTIIKQIPIENFTQINDLTIWNNSSRKKQLIIATKQKNSISVVDFDDFMVLKSKETLKKKKTFPANITKVLKKKKSISNMQNNILTEECLVSFESKNGIMLYE